MTSDGAADPAELIAERRHLALIKEVHGRHLERARQTATMLAADAAEAAEDGIRDLYDEDAEADAAVAAALVRQLSDRAMHAYRRVNELEAMGQALAFGYTTDDRGNRLNVGRLSVIDGEEALLVDWRADAAVPFYRATPLDRLGVEQRRHLLYGDGVSTSSAELHGYSDEVFSIDALADKGAGLRGEAALLASVTAPTVEQMRSVVATIQAEQDAVIRAPSNKPLVVQGGPGTGKTVVALHRAAYLLYDQRASLAESGVLVVGPSAEFLRYIRGVLPSLGETGVVSVTVSKLFPGVLLGLRDPPDVAAIKGGLAMAELLAVAVADRQRQPRSELQVWYGSARVVLSADELGGLFARASLHQTHNEGAQAFREEVIAALVAKVHNPSFDNLDDANETFGSSVDVQRFLYRHWPPLTPEQALNDLLGSKALLRSAARGVTAMEFGVADAGRLYRARTSEADLATIRWSDADIPLLDELQQLLGGGVFDQLDDRDIERDEADEFELADSADETGVDDADEDEIDEDEIERLVTLVDPHSGGGNELVDVSLDDPLFGGRVWFGNEAGSGPEEHSDGDPIGGTGS